MKNAEYFCLLFYIVFELSPWKPKSLDYPVSWVILTCGYKNPTFWVPLCFLLLNKSRRFFVVQWSSSFELRLGSKLKHFINLLIFSAVFQPVTNHSRLSPQLWLDTGGKGKHPHLHICSCLYFYLMSWDFLSPKVTQVSFCYPINWTLKSQAYLDKHLTISND